MTDASVNIVRERIGVPMQTFADLVLRSRASGDIAIIELKNTPDLTADSASRLRSNMIVHGALQRVPYFVILSQDRGYVWRPEDDPGTETPPTFEFNMGDVIAHYHPEFDPSVRLYESGLILIIDKWFDDLVHQNLECVPDPDNALKRSGLLDVLRARPELVEALG